MRTREDLRADFSGSGHPDYLAWIKTQPEGDRGVSKRMLIGDRVENLLKATGVHQTVKALEKMTGIDCGCDKRKKNLNQWDANRNEKRGI